MAEFQMQFEENFLDQLLSTDFDEIAEAALNEAVPILEKNMQTVRKLWKNMEARFRIWYN